MRAMSVSSAGSFSPASFLLATRSGQHALSVSVSASGQRALLDADPLVDDARLLEEEEHAVDLVQALSAGTLNTHLVLGRDALGPVQLALRQRADQSCSHRPITHRQKHTDRYTER